VVGLIPDLNGSFNWTNILLVLVVLLDVVVYTAVGNGPTSD
jgi:hypothetical protein